MRKPRKPRHMNPELARQRRMATYPQEMFDILLAASQGKNYVKQFDAHNAAGAFVARWGKFRIDAIECHVPGALHSRSFRVSGRDSTGELFNTRYQGVGPYTITWYYDGPPPGTIEALHSFETRTDQQQALTEGQISVPTAYQDEALDPFEKMIEEKYMKEDKK